MADYRALYRKFRSVDFDDVCGQNAVTDILKYEVEQHKLSHAYLFCGSRGTGKTSCAKILAKAVNCLHPRNGNPCNACEACHAIDKGLATDVIEMDAASNNGVDNVRDLKDEIAFTPAELKYRVYIIDEVHMMSQSAFNALLKTLEEPPTYVVFILATTEFHKLPTTIVSRCQRFDFKRIATDVIIGRLQYIAEKENIDLTEDAARMIARSSAGGMRDAISLLELCAGGGKKVDAETVSTTVGAAGREQAYRMLCALSASDYVKMYGVVRDVVMSGADMSVFLQDLTDAYRDLAVVKTNADAKYYLDLTEDEVSLLSSLKDSFTMTKIFYHASVLRQAILDIQKTAGTGRSVAEIAFARMCDPKTQTSAESLLCRVEDLEKQLTMLKLGISEEKSGTCEKAEPVTVEKKTEPMPVEIPSASSSWHAYKKWARTVDRIAEIKKSLSVQFIRAEAQTADERTFRIRMNPFFAKRLQDSAEDMSILRGILAELETCSPSDICLEISDTDAQKFQNGAENDNPFQF